MAGMEKGEIILEDNEFSYNFGLNKGVLYIESFLQSRIMIINNKFKSNIAAKSGAVVEIIYGNQGDSEVILQNTSFENCYGKEIGCLAANTEEQNLTQSLQIINITYIFSSLNWTEDYTKLLQYQPEYWTTKLIQDISDIFPECEAYPEWYFYFEIIPTMITNFQFHNNAIQVNSLCVLAMHSFPNIVKYDKLNKGSFGKANLNLTDTNIHSQISSIPGDSIENCDYNGFSAKGKAHKFGILFR